jgi:hypothetical protein
MKLLNGLLDKTRDQRLAEASPLGRRIYYSFVAVIFTWILSVWLYGIWWR